MPRELATLPHPAAPSPSGPLGSLLPSPCSPQEIPTTHPLPEVLSPTLTLTPSAPLPTHPSRSQSYVLQSHRSGPRTSTELLKSDLGPLNSLHPSTDGCRRNPQPTPHQGGPVIAVQHQDEVCDGQHPCGVWGGMGVSLGIGVEGRLRAQHPCPTWPVSSD